MTKRLITIGAAACASLLILSATPWGASAQQSIRNITIDPASEWALEVVTELGSIAGTLESILTGLSVDATRGDPVKASGPQVMYEAAIVGGFPSPVSAGQANRPKVSPEGVTYATLINGNGTAGCTPGSEISTGAVLEEEIKATAGYLHSLVVSSVDATPVFVKVYNLTAANADESDTPTWRFAIGASGGGMVLPIDKGALFDTAITVRVTTGGADNDTGALTANEVFLSWCVN